jgi:hypothetical protein
MAAATVAVAATAVVVVVVGVVVPSTAPVLAAAVVATPTPAAAFHKTATHGMCQQALRLLLGNLLVARAMLMRAGMDSSSWQAALLTAAAM